MAATEGRAGAGKKGTVKDGKKGATGAGKVSRQSLKQTGKAAQASRAGAASPEHQRSQAGVTDGAVGMPARDEAVAPPWAQGGELLTTPTGAPVDDTDNCLKVGARGPTLLEDFHLREKITHFDHERIPERVVHARGAARPRRLRVLRHRSPTLTKAGLPGRDGRRRPPVFVRFSTVLGSRGSADTVRDTRGFAVKFYTDEGNFDLVGNNMPVFFIQDGIKFPDVIHAAKPHPDREIPQAQSAHDTFWDFVSLHTEATHHVHVEHVATGASRARTGRWRASASTPSGSSTPRARRSLVKFHWKPVAGVHSLVWEEAQIARRHATPTSTAATWPTRIEAGAFPEWELGVQVMPGRRRPDASRASTCSTRPSSCPRSSRRCSSIGKLTLNRNPTNYFAETEQVAFRTGHLVRGIDVTDDPLMQARLFSYLDTQLTRLGGPNFDQLPINRPRSPVNTNERDGFGQQVIHEGRGAVLAQLRSAAAARTMSALPGWCPPPAT